MEFEALNFFVIFGKKHLDYIVSSYLEFYNELRPHQALDNRPLTGKWSEVDDPLTEGEQCFSLQCPSRPLADSCSPLRVWQEFVRFE